MQSVQSEYYRSLGCGSRTFDKETQIALAKRGDKQAMDALIESHLPLVLSIVNRVLPEGSSDPAYMDVVQTGNLSLVKACRRFNPDRNVKFTTYAYQAILNDVQNAAFRELPLKMSEYTLRQYASVVRKADTLEQECGRAPSPQEVSDALGMDTKQVTQYLQYHTTPTLELDAGIGPDGDIDLRELISAEHADVEKSLSLTPEEAVIKSECSELFMEELRTILSDQQLQFVLQRFGFDNGGKMKTMVEIGDMYGCSKQYVSSVINKALRSLRKSPSLFRLASLMQEK